MPKALTYIFRGALLVDGTGAEPAVGDLALAGERIAAAGSASGLPSDRSLRVVNCSGLAVAPGFIDVHTHGDLSLLAAPEASSHALQGVATVICGNCGTSAFPARGARAERLAEAAAELGLKASWQDLPGYLKRIESAPAAVNVGLLIGHGAVRDSFLGCEDREPTAAELRAMRDEVRKAVELGCLGMSSGLIYPPGVFARTEELVALAREAGRAGGLYVSHIRSEGAGLEAAVEEFIRIGREAEIPVHLSHLKVSGQENWPKIDWLLERLEAARADGLRLSADRYPYTASETGLDMLLPSWAFDGGPGRLLERLTERTARSRLEREVAAAGAAPDFWERVVIGTVSEPSLRGLQGRTVAEVAAERRRPPIEVYFQTLIEDQCRTQAMFHRMSEGHLERILKLPWVAIGSDASPRGRAGPTAAGHPHPRGWGSFPRLLARYVRHRKVLSLAEAVRRMTSLPAEVFGLKERGRLQPGCFADLAFFAPDAFTDAATYREPKKPPKGLVHLFVNGRPVVLNGAETGERPGRLLRRA